MTEIISKGFTSMERAIARCMLALWDRGRLEEFCEDEDDCTFFFW